MKHLFPPQIFFFFLSFSSLNQEDLLESEHQKKNNNKKIQRNKDGCFRCLFPAPLAHQVYILTLTGFQKAGKEREPRLMRSN